MTIYITNNWIGQALNYFLYWWCKECGADTIEVGRYREKRCPNRCFYKKYKSSRKNI